MITRRALFAKLAALPFLGAWLARPAAVTNDPSYCIGVDQGPRPRGRWLRESDGLGGESCRPLDAFDQLIRWIPVTERLPEIIPGARFGILGISADVIIANASGAHAGRLYKHDDGRFVWGSGFGGASIDGVTHWAELPSPPMPTKPIGAPDYAVCRDGTVLSWG